MINWPSTHYLRPRRCLFCSNFLKATIKKLGKVTHFPSFVFFPKMKFYVAKLGYFLQKIFFFEKCSVIPLIDIRFRMRPFFRKLLKKNAKNGPWKKNFQYFLKKMRKMDLENFFLIIVEKMTSRFLHPYFALQIFLHKNGVNTFVDLFCRL